MRFFIPIFSITLLLSAGLLFSVQPMFSKMILPMLGGTSLVWNTSMMFFQIMLLLGYCYAHLSARYLPPILQAFFYLVLLIVSALLLPFAINPDMINQDISSQPLSWQLSIMAMTIGLPFFTISVCAPLLQSWFAKTGHKQADNPYFLYGASNIGSTLSLLSYPFVIEPLYALSSQTQYWAYGFYTLAIMVAVCALLMLKSKTSTKSTQTETNEPEENITFKIRLKWVGLAFLPSSLMLGVTGFITQDVASVPLLWVMPLTLYLTSFIIVFSNTIRVNQAKLLNILSIVLVCMLAHMFVLEYYSSVIVVVTLIHFAAFFLLAILCHDKLVLHKPTTRHLTEFYVFMSIGGALGGVFNSLIAPVIFDSIIEYQLVFIISLFVCYSGALSYFKNLSNYIMEDMKNFALQKGLPYFYILSALFYALTYLPDLAPDLKRAFLAAFFLSFVIPLTKAKKTFFLAFIIFIIMPNKHFSVLKKSIFNDNVIERTRNFYGTIEVVELPTMIQMMHGTTLHGAQLKDKDKRLEPISYYHKDSPFAQVFSLYDQSEGEQNIAVLGLGTGAISCFIKEERHFDFYEIDPAVKKIAEDEKYFTYLKDCQSSYNIILEDARIGIEKKADGAYDIIFVDAFSSDNIPMHLITKEAAQIYLSKVKEDGIVSFHISNRHYNLVPILAKIANTLDVEGLYYQSAPPNDKKENPEDAIKTAMSLHFMMSRNGNLIKELEHKNWQEVQPSDYAHINLWTDQYSNIFDALKIIQH